MAVSKRLCLALLAACSSDLQQNRASSDTDKLDYWQSVWRRSDNPFDGADGANYDADATVWRIELRYHHSFIQQFASGSVDLSTGGIIDTRSFGEFSAHLNGLWRYGISQLKMLSCPGYFDPF